MVFKYGDAHWVSRRLDKIASSDAGTLWVVNPCEEGMCSIAVDDTGQDDCPGIL